MRGPSVAVGSKTGHLFLFHRLTGKPIFPIAEKRVPVSDVEGESSAQTQPFPSHPENLVRQEVREEDLWGTTQADLEACRETFRSLRNDGIFTPPSLRGSLIVPGNVGGLHWGGVAWDPANRLLIAPVNNLPAIIRLIPRDQFAEARKKYPERETTEQNGTPFAMSRQFFFSPSGMPCVRPPWGEVVAIRADTGAVAWRVPLGEMGPAKGAVNLGGAAVNDAGVVFLGAAVDGYIRAFDTANGNEIWKSQLPAGARATPLVFRTKQGRQMVAIAAGGFDLPGMELDTKLVAFALSD
jgi:quinoprotein glucose dehydrogenase